MERILLHDKEMRLALLSYGAITQGWWLGDLPLVLGYETPDAYLSDRGFLGAIAGRVANRIGGASFAHEGRQVALAPNEGSNQLHGGAEGFWCQNWQVQSASRSQAHLHLLSPDGAGGFPGAVRVDLHVRLEAPCLTYEITARPDRPTPISIAQHNYYCLGGSGSALEHKMRLAAAQVLELDGEAIPTGALIEIAGSALDFRRSRALAEGLAARPAGLDDFFVFEPGRDTGAAAVELCAPNNLSLRVFSDQPGAQIYTGQGLSGAFAPFDGVCIEPSGYPNAVNRPAFPSVIASPERPYRQVLRLEIGQEAA